jgi:non-specific serine/threonine protein kinase/serine/threonine-protein kinase
MSEEKSEFEVEQATPAWIRLGEGSPARLRRRLTGDVDTIVLHALRKEPQRRYASVEQFEGDIRRHLEGLPVTARRDSWRYRAEKFAVRHKLAVAATALILFAVVGGVTATVREARIAAASQRRAEQRFNDVRKLANSLMFEIDDSIRDLPGSTSARRLIVTRAQEYLDSLSQQSKDDVSLQKELAAAYERVGDVLGYPYGANLGDKDGALQNYRKALAIRESLGAGARNDGDLNRDVAGTYVRIAHILESSGDFAGALAALGNAQGIAERLVAGSKDPVLADLCAGVYYFTASIQVQTGSFAAALANYRHSSSIREAALQANPGSVPLRAHLAADDAGIAQCLELSHDLSQAIEIQSKAVAILDDVVKSNAENATLSEYLGEGLNRLATFRKEQGDVVAALETYRKAHGIFGELMKADAKNRLAKSNFGFSNDGIASSLMALGRPAEAANVYQESIASFEEMSPRTEGSRYPRSGLAEAYSGVGDAESALAGGKGLSADQRREYWAQAHAAYQKSLTLWNDKEKRGELESGEHDERALVAQHVAESERHIAPLSSKRGGTQ